MVAVGVGEGFQGFFALVEVVEVVALVVWKLARQLPETSQFLSELIAWAGVAHVVPEGVLSVVY